MFEVINETRPQQVKMVKGKEGKEEKLKRKGKLTPLERWKVHTLGSTLLSKTTLVKISI